MSDTTHIIRINQPYIKYKVDDKIHIFTVKVADLIANSLEHEYNEQGEVFFLLYNQVTEKGVVVKLKASVSSLSMRVYENAHNPEKIVQLIVI